MHIVYDILEMVLREKIFFEIGVFNKKSGGGRHTTLAVLYLIYTYIYDDNLHGLHCSNVLGNYQRYSKTVFCILFMTYWRWFCAKKIFRKNFIWRHNDVIKNVYFLMKCSVKSVKHAFLTAILALLYEINMYFLNFYRLENEMKLMLKKIFFEIFWIWPTFFQKKFLRFFFFFTIFFLKPGLHCTNVLGNYER